MLEAFVIALCIGNYECGEAAKAYSKTPAGIHYTSRAKQMAYKYMDKDKLATLGIFVAAASNKRMKLRVYQGIVLEGNRDEIGLVYKYNF